MSELSYPFISVIVPIYQQWNIAFQLIEALESQNLDKRSWELILVDNGSDEIPENSKIPSFAKLTHCSTPGAYAARNAGLKVAKGNLLVFTDADCRPKPDWLTQLSDYYKKMTDIQLIAGAINVSKFDRNPPNSIELFDITLGLPQQGYVSRGYAVTANLAIPKEVFDEIGYFDESRFSGGDAEICRRARKKGYMLMYTEKALIEHPARMTWRELEIKTRRVKGGQIKAGSLLRRLQYFIRAFLPPIRGYSKILKNKTLKFKEKLSVLNIQTKLWWVEMDEATKLIIGKKPERR